MFSRTLVIVLSFGVAVVQATRGHWVEVAGLVGLGTGLVLLRLAGSGGSPQVPDAAPIDDTNARRPRPALRWAAWACFAVTVVAMVFVYQRDY